MSSSAPRVSVGLAVYNGENFLRPTLDSLLAQTFRDFELIISDNGSTDATEAICQEYAARDDRISYHRSVRNMGMSWNYNRLFALARGEYFKWADHDDLCAPEFLERCVSALDAHREVVLCDTIPSDIDEHGAILATKERYLPTDDPLASRRFYHFLHDQHDLQQIAGLMRSSALRQTTLHETYPTADLVLLAGLALIGPFYRVRENLFFYRRHRQQTVFLSRFERYRRLEPSKVGRIVLPEWEAYWGLIRCVARVSLPIVERLRCYLCLLGWPIWHQNWLRMTKDLVRAVLLNLGYRGRWSLGEG